MVFTNWLTDSFQKSSRVNISRSYHESFCDLTRVVGYRAEYYIRH